MTDKPQKHTKSAGGVVLNQQNDVLVVSQHGTSWSLPKGHLEPGEDALSAAKREIQEESGIKNLTLIQSLGSYERYRIGLKTAEDTSELKTIYMYLFKTLEEDLAPEDAHHPEARWVHADKVASLLTHPKDKEFFIRVAKECDFKGL